MISTGALVRHSADILRFHLHVRDVVALLQPHAAGTLERHSAVYVYGQWRGLAAAAGRRSSEILECHSVTRLVRHSVSAYPIMSSNGNFSELSFS